MPGLKALVVLALSAQLVLLLALRQSTTARFVDQSQTSTNTFVAKTMQTPGLTATVSGATVTLGWTNPDALTGANASFIVQRASGDCAAPGAFAPLAGSPFPATALTATDTPAAGGTYCYSIQSALHSWRSAAASATAAVQKSGIAQFRLRSGAPGICSAGASLRVGAGSGNLVIPGRGSVLFAAPSAEGATRVPSGDQVATLYFPGVSTARNATYTVQLGTCGDGVFTPLATASDDFRLDVWGATRVLTLRVSNEVALPSGTYLALRVTNDRQQNLRLNGTVGESTLAAPSGAGY